MSNTWVVVAESSRAKIYEYDKHDKKLTELKIFTNPLSRIHAHQINSSLGNHSKNFNDRSIIGKNINKQQQSTSFARSLSNHLDTARNKHKFKKLIVISPPEFLGKLRKNMSHETQKSVISEIDKNLVRHKMNDIQAHIPH